MTTIRTALLAAVIVGMMPAQTSAQPQSDASIAGAASTDSAAETVQRNISIAELGYMQGIEFSTYSGGSDLFFPIPQTGLASATLALRVRSGSAFESRRSLQIRVAGEIVATHALTEQDADSVIEIPIDLTGVAGDFLPVSITYSGAVTDDRCLDQRVAGDFVSILPASTLNLELGPDALDSVRDVLALMPRDVTVRMPEGDLNSSQAAAVLRMAALMNSRGARVTFAEGGDDVMTSQAAAGSWATGQILISANPQDENAGQGPEESSATSSVSVLNLESGPAILIDGEDAGAAAHFLASTWSAMANATDVAITASRNGQQPGAVVTFAELGFDTSTTQLVDRAIFEAGFTATDLPSGTRPEHLSAELAISNDFASTNATIALFMNDSLLASTTSSGAVPARLTAPIPAGLYHRNNSIRVVVQRQPQTGDCANPPQGFPVQLLASSTLELGADSDTPQDFFELSSRFGEGVTIFLPDTAEVRNSVWPGLSRIVSDLVPASAPIAVQFGEPDADMASPFILISDALPATLTAPVRFDGERVVVSGPDDEPLLDVTGLQGQGLAELVQSDTAAGLWVYPGSDGLAESPEPMGLDRGNVALLKDGRVSFAFSTLRDRLVQVDYPDRTSYLDLLAQYRLWLIGALWVVLTVIFIFALSRFYRRRSS